MTNWLEGPILFLDGEGVLNSRRYFSKLEEAGGFDGFQVHIDPEAARHLQRIVDETGCSLVLTSTWRLSYCLADMRGKLIAAGMPHPVPLRDQTPYLGDSGIKTRGREVREWISNRWSKGDGVLRYVCLDDIAQYFPDQPFVQTTYADGLTAEQADLCIAILKGETDGLKATAAG